MRALLAVILLLPAGGGQQQFRNCAGPGGACCDTHRFCAFWARNNECVKNPGWMRPNCQLSCRVCNPNTVTTQTLGKLQ
ncbi:shTK domain protein [Necator americanus]|uniref:ShTK domain protein n=1 Tax=Necator americanus TaxID=51031 RepID=W2SZ47_NECAM|nr:shTK domain protein [Necator americanus]ETN74236.1 shTK domain protein [Necator americanus]